MKKLSGFLLCLLLACSPLLMGASSSWNFGGAIGGFQGTTCARYTPTFTNLGTVTTSHLFWCRLGSLVYIGGDFTVGSSPASGVEGRVGLPTGVVSASVIDSIYSSGEALFDHVDSDQYHTAIQPSKDYFVFTRSNSSNNQLSSLNGDNLWSSTKVSVSLIFPVESWAAGGGGAGGAKYCSGYITNSGTPAVSRSTENCAASVTDNGGGDTTVNFASSYFTAAPNCTVSPYGSSQILMYISSTTAPSASGVRFISVDSGSHSAADSDFFFNCVN